MRAYQLVFPGGTTEQYDEVIGKMGLTPEGDPPEGAVFHWVAEIEGGIVVTDVWETDAAFRTFATDKIIPLTQEAGLPEPVISEFEVHNFFGRRPERTT